MYSNLKRILEEVKVHSDLTYKSIPFFTEKIREIRVELLQVSSRQGEQIADEVTRAIRQIHITQREDLNNIDNYRNEVPKYLGRVKVSILANLSFVNK